MTNVVQLGPLMLAADRLLAVAILVGFITLLGWLGKNSASDLGKVATYSIAMGLLAARVAYVLMHLEAYSSDPLATLALWQGGFSAWAGILGAAGMLVYRLGLTSTGARALGALALCAGAWFLGSAFLAPRPQPAPKMPVLTTISGQPVGQNFASGPYVVNLWATWCPPCRRELPMLAEVAATSPVPILLVNEGEERELVAAFLANSSVPADAVALDSGAALAGQLGSAALPTTLFIDGRGRVLATHMGEISRAALLDEITKLKGT